MTQRSDLIDRAREAAGIDASDPRVPDAFMNVLINRALRQISTDAPWPWLQVVDTSNLVTVADTASYTPPTVWQATDRISYNNMRLARIQPEEAPRYYYDTAGSPRAFTVEGDKIYIYPLPDGAYTLTHVYYRFEPELDDDSDEPLLPEQYEDYLLSVAGKLLALRVSDREQYIMFRDEQRGWVDRMKDDVSRVRGPLRPRTRNDWTLR